MTTKKASKSRTKKRKVAARPGPLHGKRVMRRGPSGGGNVRTPLAESLRSWRLKHGLSQGAAAEKLLVSKRCYHDWERGNRVPQRAAMARISKALAA